MQPALVAIILLFVAGIASTLAKECFSDAHDRSKVEDKAINIVLALMFFALTAFLWVFAAILIAQSIGPRPC